MQDHVSSFGIPADRPPTHFRVPELWIIARTDLLQKGATKDVRSGRTHKNQNPPVEILHMGHPADWASPMCLPLSTAWVLRGCRSRTADLPLTAGMQFASQKTLRCGSKCSILLLSLSVLASTHVAKAQSVADAAREARERKEKTGSKPARVITDDDFERALPPGVQSFPSVRASFRVPDGWSIIYDHEGSVGLYCPGAKTPADECFITIKSWDSADSSPGWEERVLHDYTVREPIAGTDILLLEPWHEVQIGKFPARQTVLETGISANTPPNRHERRKYIVFADSADHRCYSLDIYVQIYRADEYIAAYDGLLATFRPFPGSPKSIQSPQQNQSAP